MLPGLQQRFQEFVGAAEQINAGSTQLVGRICRFESPVAVLTHYLAPEILDAHLQTTATGWAFLHEVG